MSDTNKRVTVLDPVAKTFTEILARELNQGMIRVKVEGREGECWMDSSLVQMGAVKHQSLDSSLTADIEIVMAALAEVYPLTREEWVDGFKRDLNPEQEVAIWKHLADVYTEANRRQQFSHEQLDDVFQVLVNCTLHNRANVLKFCKLKCLSRSDAESVIKNFFGVV